MVLFGNKIKEKQPYEVALVITTIISTFRLLAHFNIATDTISELKSFIPLGNHNLEWVVPSFVGFVVTYFIIKKTSSKSVSV